MAVVKQPYHILARKFGLSMGATQSHVSNIEHNQIETVPARQNGICGNHYESVMYCGGGHRRYKAYIAIFICFVTKAVVIELVGYNCTETCIAALRNIIARVGISSQICSDCGTNNRLQEEEIKYIPTWENCSVCCNERNNIELQPAAAPLASSHFGGI